MSARPVVHTGYFAALKPRQAHDDAECVVCNEELLDHEGKQTRAQVALLPCMHTLCEDCFTHMQTLSQHRGKCPECRGNITGSLHVGVNGQARYLALTQQATISHAHDGGTTRPQPTPQPTPQTPTSYASTTRPQPHQQTPTPSGTTNPIRLQPQTQSGTYMPRADQASVWTNHPTPTEHHQRDTYQRATYPAQTAPYPTVRYGQSSMRTVVHNGRTYSSMYV